MLDILEAKAILDDILDELPNTTWKSAFGFPCFFAEGRVFGLYDGDFIVLRFQPAQVDTLVGQGEGFAFKPRPNIATANTWVRIAHDQLAGPERLRELILLSYETRIGE